MPSLSISRPASVSDTTTTTIGPGARHKPATAGGMPQTVVRSMTPPSSIAPWAAENINSARQLDHIGSTRIAARSTAGDGWCSDRHTARAIAQPAPTVASTTVGACHPATGSWISAHTSAPTPAIRLTAPSRSGMPLPVPGSFTRIRSPATSASSPTGTLTKKIQRQDNSTRNPPTGGPSAAAIAATADQVLTATARREAGTAASNSASELGISIAAPRAGTARAATSATNDPDSPHAADPSVNTTRPDRKMRRWPYRSPSRPAGFMNAAKTSVYAFRIHDIAPKSAAPKVWRISGKAMFTMNRSRLARNPAVDTTTTVAAGRVAAACVVVVTFASRLHSLTDRQGHGARTIAGYSRLYLAGHRCDTAE